jgi:hypothetical protein
MNNTLQLSIWWVSFWSIQQKSFLLKKFLLIVELNYDETKQVDNTFDHLRRHRSATAEPTTTL